MNSKMKSFGISSIFPQYSKIEKIFIVACIIQAVLYFVMSIKYMIALLNDNTSIIVAFLFVLIAFIPLISSIITIWARTVLHGIIFLILNTEIAVVYIVYAKFCRDLLFCRARNPEYFYVYLYTAIIHGSFTIIYYILIFLFWYYKIWITIKEMKVTSKRSINTMYKRVQYQMVLIHATFTTVGSWAYYSWIIELYFLENRITLSGNEVEYSVWPAYIPDQLIFLFSLTFVLKAIREELRWMTYLLLLSNFIEMGFIAYRLAWCPYDGSFGRCDFVNRIRHESNYVGLFITGMVCLILTTLHFINLVICCRNFGKNLGFYMKYVEIPPEYEYDDDIPRKRQKIIRQV